MGRFAKVHNSVYGVFAADEWVATGIATYPTNFTPPSSAAEFIRVNVLPQAAGANVFSVSGVLMIDIKTLSAKGMASAISIADSLDTFLLGELIALGDPESVQFTDSVFKPVGPDKSNSALFISQYQITFNFYGVLQ